MILKNIKDDDKYIRVFVFSGNFCLKAHSEHSAVMQISVKWNSQQFSNIVEL
jgi:hypothetical protein